MNAQEVDLQNRSPLARERFDSGGASSNPTHAELACRADEIDARAWESLYEAAPSQVRSALGTSSSRVGSVTLLMARGVEASRFNRAIAIGMTTPTSTAGVACIAKAFDAFGVDRWWLQVNSSSCPSSLASRLETSMWTREPHLEFSKMVRKTGFVESEATTLRVEAAASGTVTSIITKIVESLSVPTALVAWLHALSGSERWRIYGLFDGNVCVGGGLLYVEDAYAWMGISGVLDSHRGRGGHRALVARRVYDARRFGARWISSEATEAPEPGGLSMETLWRCGFQRVATVENLIQPKSIGATQVAETRLKFSLPTPA